MCALVYGLGHPLSVPFYYIYSLLIKKKATGIGRKELLSSGLGEKGFATFRFWLCIIG